MKILIVGNGGREHALLWKLGNDAPAARFFATRPNPGMAALAEGVDLAPDDVAGIASWAEGNDIDVTVVGPEGPLALGVTDALRRRSLAVFGPTAGAARIESSKAFAKDLMERAGVPTADHRTFTSFEDASAYITSRDEPMVVKASGLAAGKGAVVCESPDEALDAARSMLERQAFGDAGAEIVIEEFMEGEEISVFGITDGRDVVLLPASQDHKRIGEGDTGPNTGGMGAYAPVSIVDDALLSDIQESVFLPTLGALEEEGYPFRGLLYAGLMLTPEGTRVVEFNCRFGDPETQVVLPLLDGSLLELLVPVARGGSIAGAAANLRAGAALNTVLASAGYPGNYDTGYPVTIPDSLSGREDVLIFHAGTRTEDGGVVTSGGRVLSVVGIGSDLPEAREKSLEAAAAIDFEGKTFRRDIGWRAFQHPEAVRG